MVQKKLDRKHRDSRLFIGLFMLVATLLFGGTAWMLSVRIGRMMSQDENIAEIDFSGKWLERSLQFIAFEEQ